MSWKKYKRRTVTEMRPFNPSEDTGYHGGKPGDMIARDAANHSDEWLVTEDFFKDNYDLVPE